MKHGLTSPVRLWRTPSPHEERDFSPPTSSLGEGRNKRRGRVVSVITFFFAILFIYVWINYSQQKEMKSIKIGSTQIQVETSDEIGEQVQGLSGRDSLCDNCGMLFVYDKAMIQNFWMKGMNFPLDFIFIREGRVVEIVKNVPSPESLKVSRVVSTQEADMVLEVNAGFVERKDISTGGIVILE